MRCVPTICTVWNSAQFRVLVRAELLVNWRIRIIYTSYPTALASAAVLAASRVHNPRTLCKLSKYRVSKWTARHAENDGAHTWRGRRDAVSRVTASGIVNETQLLRDRKSIYIYTYTAAGYRPPQRDVESRARCKLDTLKRRAAVVCRSLVCLL